MKAVVGLLLLLLGSAGGTQPAVAAITLGEEPLDPVSCGVRDTLWVDHYRAVLYLPRGAPIESVRDPRTPKAVVIRIVDARYLPSRIPAKWRRALETRIAAEPMQRIRDAYRRLRKGDVVAFTYAPASGVALRVNGDGIFRGDGHAVIDAILDAWARPEPVARKLHRLAIEHPCA